MKTRIGMMLVLVLIFAGCSRQGDQGTTQETEKSAVQKEALESKREAPPEQAAKTEEDPDVKNCLQLVSQAKFDEALPVCLDAVKKHPADERLQEAVKTAQAAVSEAAAAGTEAAKEAQEGVGEKAQGALGTATGGVTP